MKKCPLEKIDGFQSYLEFEDFLDFINEQIQIGNARKLQVEKPYMGVTSIDESWYLHIESDQVWRLVWPDPPFTGLFEQVNS